MQLASIVIPVWNEEEAIGQVIDDTIAAMEKSRYPYEIIVVDDGSTDRTAEIVRARPTVRLVQHTRNRGVGRARNTGIRAALGDVIVMTDGDGTYPVQDIPRLLDAMEMNDMVIGARRREAGTVKWLRSPAKWLIRSLACYLTATNIPDLNSGLRAFKKDIAAKYFHLFPPGHSWVSTITIAFLSDGYSVAFVPIDYYERTGRSTFHPIRDTYNYLVAVLRSITYFNPLKVFLPLSILLMSAGVLKTIYDLVSQGRIKESDVTLVTIGVLIGVLGLLADLIVTQSKKE